MGTVLTTLRGLECWDNSSWDQTASQHRLCFKHVSEIIDYSEVENFGFEIAIYLVQ